VTPEPAGASPPRRPGEARGGRSQGLDHSGLLMPPTGAPGKRCPAKLGSPPGRLRPAYAAHDTGSREAPTQHEQIAERARRAGAGQALSWGGTESACRPWPQHSPLRPWRRRQAFSEAARDTGGDRANSDVPTEAQLARNSFGMVAGELATADCSNDEGCSASISPFSARVRLSGARGGERAPGGWRGGGLAAGQILS